MNPELLAREIADTLGAIDTACGALWRLYDFMDDDRLAGQIKELREHAGRVEEELRQFGVQLLQQQGQS